MDPYQTAADLYGQATGAYQQLATPQLGEGAQFGPDAFAQAIAGSMNNFTNPYYDDVIQGALGDMTRAKEMSLNNVGAQATGAGAFGGARHGIAEGQIHSDFARNFGNLSADLNTQNFNQALQAAFGATSAGQNQQGLAQGAAGALSQLGSQYYNIGNNIADRQMDQGEMQRMLLQQVLSGGNDQFDQYMEQPYRSIDLINAVLAADPRRGNATTNTTQTTKRGFLSTVGTLAQMVGGTLTGIGDFRAGST